METGICLQSNLSVEKMRMMMLEVWKETGGVKI